MEESECIAIEALPILAQASAAVQLGDGALHDPAPGQYHEFSDITASYDLDIHRTADLSQSLVKLCPLIARVGVKFQEERIQSEQCRHQHDTAITILDIGRVDRCLHQQALHIDEDMPLLALDPLASVKTGRIDASTSATPANRVR